MVSKIYPDAPRVAVGALVLHQNKVLLVLRGQEPSKGLWAIPGGGVELGESLQSAAEREIFEETGLRIKAGQIIYTFDTIEHDPNGRVKYHYIIIDLMAIAINPDHPLHPADDVSDAAWFTLDEINNPELPISEPTRHLVQMVMGN